MEHKPYTIFIATSFAPACRERAQILADLFSEAGFHCVFGEGFGGTQLSEGVRKRLSSADVVVALLEPANGSKREPSRWVLQEVTFATALKKPCLLLVEKGVRFSQGLLGDIEFINFEASNYAAVFPQVFCQLNIIMRNKRLVIGSKEAPSPRLYISKDPGEKECNDMARAQIKSASKLTERMKYDEALKHAKNATRLDPNCWQAWIKYSGLLLEAGRLAEGTKIHVQVLRDFKGNKIACAAAKHNLAVTKELQFGLDSIRANKEAEPLYESALSLDPFRVYTRAALICTYLRLDKRGEATRLLEQSLSYTNEGFISVMRRELDESVDGIRLLTFLPTWAQNLLYPLPRRRGLGWLGKTGRISGK